jgi:hypothetical protein
VRGQRVRRVRRKRRGRQRCRRVRGRFTWRMGRSRSGLFCRLWARL